MLARPKSGSSSCVTTLCRSSAKVSQLQQVLGWLNLPNPLRSYVTTMTHSQNRRALLLSGSSAQRISVDKDDRLTRAVVLMVEVNVA